MFLNEIEMSVQALRITREYTCPQGWRSGELSEMIQNNVFVIFPCNFIAISVSQVIYLALGLFWCAKMMGWINR